MPRSFPFRRGGWSILIISLMHNSTPEGWRQLQKLLSHHASRTQVFAIDFPSFTRAGAKKMSLEKGEQTSLSHRTKIIRELFCSDLVSISGSQCTHICMYVCPILSWPPACHVLSSSRAGQFKQAFSFKCRFLFPAALCQLNDSVITRRGETPKLKFNFKLQTANGTGAEMMKWLSGMGCTGRKSYLISIVQLQKQLE